MRWIALLMESWLSVGPRYNVHYIYLPGLCGPPQMMAEEGPSPSKHKAVKRFNSIRTGSREDGWRNRELRDRPVVAASSNLTPPLVDARVEA